MTALDRILATARGSTSRIVLSEGEDPRIAHGACRALEAGICVPILLGNQAAVNARVAEAGGTPGSIQIVDPVTSPDVDAYAREYLEMRRHKGISLDIAARTLRDPLAYAAMMVRQGDADGTIGGAVATTADTLRAAIQIIGRAPGTRTVSSFFLMVLDQPHHPVQGPLAFADCGLVVEPDADELAQIAISTADSFVALTGQPSRVAMLSFSTTGSARHSRVSKVSEATRTAQTMRPDLTIDGELQFDAAFVPDVAASKAPDSPLRGAANVLIFPSLEAANIGYKIAQRIGGATAIGPILQGLAKPANDLSRGCSPEDVFLLIAVTSLQAMRQLD